MLQTDHFSVLALWKSLQNAEGLFQCLPREA